MKSLAPLLVLLIFLALPAFADEPIKTDPIQPNLKLIKQQLQDQESVRRSTTDLLQQMQKDINEIKQFYGETAIVPSKQPGVFIDKDKHPLVYKASYPVRKTWGGAVWLGEKTQPIHPFLALCGYAGQLATPVLIPFFRR